MYLCQSLTNFENETFSMLGLLPTDVRMSPKLALGYRRAQVIPSHSWLHQTAPFHGHEFHRSQLSHSSPNPLYQQQGLLPKDPPYKAGWFTQNLHAAYLHRHWGDQPQLIEQFFTACLAFQKKLS
jgi:cobyrinic acid a,c-diamide synthase